LITKDTDKYCCWPKEKIGESIYQNGVLYLSIINRVPAFTSRQNKPCIRDGLFWSSTQTYAVSGFLTKMKG